MNMYGSIKVLCVLLWGTTLCTMGTPLCTMGTPLCTMGTSLCTMTSMYSELLGSCIFC